MGWFLIRRFAEDFWKTIDYCSEHKMRCNERRFFMNREGVMTQIDFNKLFKHKTYKPLNYKLRDGANRTHDIIFLDSYIHDATLFQKGKIFFEYNLMINIL